MTYPLHDERTLAILRALCAADGELTLLQIAESCRDPEPRQHPGVYAYRLGRLASMGYAASTRRPGFRVTLFWQPTATGRLYGERIKAHG